MLSSAGILNISSIRPDLTNLLSSVSGSIALLNAAQGVASSQLSIAASIVNASLGFEPPPFPGLGLLSALAYAPVYNQYSSFKYQLCCSLMDQVAAPEFNSSRENLQMNAKMSCFSSSPRAPPTGPF